MKNKPDLAPVYVVAITGLLLAALAMGAIFMAPHEHWDYSVRHVDIDKAIVSCHRGKVPMVLTINQNEVLVQCVTGVQP